MDAATRADRTDTRHLRTSAALEIRGLSVRFDPTAPPTLDGCDLTLERGRLVALVGPNGAGKSTLLRASLGLLPSACVEGSVTIDGQSSLNARRRRVAYIPQRESVDWDFPIQVGEVVETGLLGRDGRRGFAKLFGRLTRQERARAGEALDRVGLAEYAAYPIGALSGGQQQRVFLARALVQDAPVFFMDEALSGVDTVSEQIVFDLLRGLCDEGKTIVVVHHDLDTVRTRFEEAILLRQRLIAHGPPNDSLGEDNIGRAYGW